MRAGILRERELPDEAVATGDGRSAANADAGASSAADAAAASRRLLMPLRRRACSPGCGLGQTSFPPAPSATGTIDITTHTQNGTVLVSSPRQKDWGIGVGRRSMDQ